MDYLPEKDYQKIIKSMPIFCIDFLISFQNKYLLIKRKEEPLKNLYWVIGGRLMFKEKITHAAKRIQEREIGTYFSNFRDCLLYTSPSPRDKCRSRMPSSA